MSLIDVYETVYEDVSSQTRIQERKKKRKSLRGRTGSVWPSAPGTGTQDEPLSDIKAQMIGSNDPELFEELESYADSINSFNELTDNIRDVVKYTAGRERSEVFDNISDDRLFDPQFSLRAPYLVPAGSEDRQDGESMYDWVATNISPILQADGAGSFEDALKDAAEEIHYDFEALYEDLENDELSAAGQDVYDELWGLVTDDRAVEINGESYSIKDALVKREVVREDIIEQAEYLEEELEYNIQEQLDEYKPSFGESIRRGLRRAFS